MYTVVLGRRRSLKPGTAFTLEPRLPTASRNEGSAWRRGYIVQPGFSAHDLSETRIVCAVRGAFYSFVAARLNQLTTNSTPSSKSMAAPVTICP